jgi:hypothetical protein
MIILPTLRGILKRPTISSGLGTVSWTTTFLNTATIGPPNPGPTYTVSGSPSNGLGIFSNVLPSSGQYFFDCTLDDGYTSGVGFFGLANTPTSYDYNSQSNYKAWYWSGAWWGSASTISNGDSSALVAGTYRVALDRTANVFYMQRLSPSASTVRSANIPASTGANIYLMMLGQSGYKACGVSIASNGVINSGKGGLY